MILYTALCVDAIGEPWLCTFTTKKRAQAWIALQASRNEHDKMLEVWKCNVPFEGEAKAQCIETHTGQPDGTFKPPVQGAKP